MFDWIFTDFVAPWIIGACIISVAGAIAYMFDWI